MSCSQKKKKHKDIEITPNKEAYENLPHQVIASFHFWTSHSPLFKCRFVIKADDDLYLSLPRFYIASRVIYPKLCPTGDYCVIGWLRKDVTPHTVGKWAVSSTQMYGSSHPIFPSGPIYAVSIEFARLTWNFYTENKNQPLLFLEDVNMGLIAETFNALGKIGEENYRVFDALSVLENKPSSLVAFGQKALHSTEQWIRASAHRKIALAALGEEEETFKGVLLLDIRHFSRLYHCETWSYSTLLFDETPMFLSSIAEEMLRLFQGEVEVMKGWERGEKGLEGERKEGERLGKGYCTERSERIAVEKNMLASEFLRIQNQVMETINRGSSAISVDVANNFVRYLSLVKYYRYRDEKKVTPDNIEEKKCGEGTLCSFAKISKAEFLEFKNFANKYYFDEFGSLLPQNLTSFITLQMTDEKMMKIIFDNFVNPYKFPFRNMNETCQKLNHQENSSRIHQNLMNIYLISPIKKRPETETTLPFPLSPSLSPSLVVSKSPSILSSPLPHPSQRVIPLSSHFPFEHQVKTSIESFFLDLILSSPRFGEDWGEGERSLREEITQLVHYFPPSDSTLSHASPEWLSLHRQFMQRQEESADRREGWERRDSELAERVEMVERRDEGERETPLLCVYFETERKKEVTDYCWKKKLLPLEISFEENPIKHHYHFPHFFILLLEELLTKREALHQSLWKDVIEPSAIVKSICDTLTAI